jgi:DNA-binding transcriptional MerR regulator/methanogenic corrinoid protein MtbC1
MYTIKEAAARTGVPIPLLRAWERRYRVVAPTRTAAGYRLYDDAALARLRSMRALVADGWQPSAAAAAILAGTAPRPPDGGDEQTQAPAEAPAGASAGALDRTGAFLAAAEDLDAPALERALDEMFASGSFEVVADRDLLPALVAIGDAWADGRITVAGEHAASEAVHRRLAAAFQAAGRPRAGRDTVLVGLPPGSRHELGALTFAVAARRAGLPILYLGADLPVTDWAATAKRTRARAAVVATPTAADVPAAAEVASRLAAEVPGVQVAAGGNAAAGVRDRVGVTVLVLPHRLVDAVDALSGALDAARPRATRARS